jgi:hypothetical protein
MKRLVQQAGERLVGMVLPQVEAGACVPDNGQCCRRDRAFNCTGRCTVVKTSC